MITIKIDGKSYEVVTTWVEMKYSHYCRVVNVSEESVMNKLSIFTGIEENILSKCSLAQICYLCELVSFMDDYENALLFVKSYEDDLSIAKKTYGQIEQAKTVLQYKKPLLALGDLVELYYCEKMIDAHIVDSMGRGLALVAKIDNFMKSYPELYEYEPTNEEIEAGVEDLAKLGSFYTVKKLADRYHKHPDEILKWEAGVVYAMLRTDAIENRISNNLQKIAMRKK